MKRKQIDQIEIQIEKQLEHAFCNITPDIFEKVSEYPVNKMEIDELESILGETTDMICTPTKVGRWEPRMKKNIWKSNIFGTLVTACIACLVIFAGFNLSNNKVDSTIGIDVNPSIEITTNKYDKVLNVMALNEDAEVILEGMDLKKVDLNVAVNAIMGSMMKNGYINDTKNSILVTVDNADQEKAQALQETVSSDITATLQEKNIKATVYKQNLSKNDSIKSLAKQYNISVGKAEFISKLMEKDPSLTIDQLAVMNMHQLSQLIATKSINVNEYLANTQTSEDITNTDNSVDKEDAITSDTEDTLTSDEEDGNNVQTDAQGNDSEDKKVNEKKIKEDNQIQDNEDSNQKDDNGDEDNNKEENQNRIKKSPYKTHSDNRNITKNKKEDSEDNNDSKYEENDNNSDNEDAKYEDNHDADDNDDADAKEIKDYQEEDDNQDAEYQEWDEDDNNQDDSKYEKSYDGHDDEHEYSNNNED